MYFFITSRLHSKDARGERAYFLNRIREGLSQRLDCWLRCQCLRCVGCASSCVLQGAGHGDFAGAKTDLAIKHLRCRVMGKYIQTQVANAALSQRFE